jgi:hypothetical protein
VGKQAEKEKEAGQNSRAVTVGVKQKRKDLEKRTMNRSKPDQCSGSHQ